MHRRLLTISVVAIACTLLTVTSVWACPYIPRPSVKQMIRQHATEEVGYPLLLLGRVRRVVDLRGGPNGRAIARFRVIEDAIGRTAGSIKVRFYRPKLGEDEYTASQYARLDGGERWALVAQRRRDGRFDIPIRCGPSERLTIGRLRDLVRLARHGGRD